MGFLDFLRGNSVAYSPVAVPVSPGTATGVISPWATGELSKIVWSDIFGMQGASVTRTEALSIPGVFKARATLTSLIADKPLKAYRGDVELVNQPTFLYRTDGGVSPWQRMAATIDDLIFYGKSLWLVARAADGSITEAQRWPIEWWEITPDGELRVQPNASSPKVPLPEENAILIWGPSEGLLTLGVRTLRGAADIESTVAARARSPIPAAVLRETTSDADIQPEEAQELIASWVRARQDPNGAVAYLPYGIELEALGDTNTDLFTEARNASRIDIANFFNLPASLLDGSLSTASLTYSTQEGKRNEVFDYGLPYWIRPIEERLSQDDVVPRGQRVRFDFSALLTNPQNPTGPVTED